MNPNEWKPQHEDAEDLVIDFDVQLHRDGAAIILPDESYDENLPGQVNLSNDDLDTLRDLLNEAWLNRHGLEMRSIPASEVRRNDVIPSLGVKVVASVDNYPSEGIITLSFNARPGFPVGVERLQISRSLEITVHRRIS